MRELGRAAGIDMWEPYSSSSSRCPATHTHREETLMSAITS